MLHQLINTQNDGPEVSVLEAEGSGGWREALARLDERFPRLSQWLGGRLDIEAPAIAVSVLIHLSLFLALATAGYAVHKESGRTFEGTTGSVDTALEDLSKFEPFQDLDQPADPPSLTPAAGSFSPNLATATVEATRSGLVNPADDAKAAPMDLARLDVRRMTDVVLPTSNVYSESVAIKGNGAEHVGDAEGAVDRLADEILRRLEQGRTLVVWAFDASGSLQAERERLAKHIETVYTHITQLDKDHHATDGGLLTEVVAFGHDRKAMTPAPTDDAEKIGRAIRDVPLDETGVETTFQTVAEIVRRWGRYKNAKGERYRLMVIVVTDEVGDDENALEEAIAVAVSARPPVPVYVLGSQAIFARAEGRMNYTDPKTGRTFYNLPVRQGPESIMPEQVRLPFWYDGDQYDVLDSGFGPYALSRLAGATGGIYFVTRLGQARMGFDPVAMREYKPDWLPRARYEAEVMGHPLRKAVIEAALITQQQNLPGMPALVFPPVDGPEFKDAMARNQASSARVEYTVDAALEPITAAARYRDRETSRRWQAHYDLIRGRLLALKVRCHGYNLACARMKKDPPKFTRPDSNAWRLVPSTEVPGGEKPAAVAKQATDLLKKVLDEHPGTPWALLAKRELKDPLGFQWAEIHVRPISRNANDSAEAEAKKKARMNTPKPPEPPKL